VDALFNGSSEPGSQLRDLSSHSAERQLASLEAYATTRPPDP